MGLGPAWRGGQPLGCLALPPPGQADEAEAGVDDHHRVERGDKGGGRCDLCGDLLEQALLVTLPKRLHSYLYLTMAADPA